GRAFPRRRVDPTRLDGAGDRRAIRQTGPRHRSRALRPIRRLPPAAARPRGHHPGRGQRTKKMRLDETGFPQPTGEFEELAADTVILALGQQADLSLLAGLPDIDQRDGAVVVGPDLMTGHPGVFAGGDMVPGERTVTASIGHGKKAASAIDAWLRA